MVGVDSTKPNLEVSGSGSFTAYFFTTQPVLSEVVADTYIESDIYMYSNEVEAFYIYMNPGSTIDVNWSIADYGYADFYILKGESEYDDFMADNYFDYEVNYYGYNGYSSFMADEAETYYLVWWNYGSNSVYLDIDIDYSLREYDLSGASISVDGAFTRSVSEYNYIVFVNESPSYDATIDYDFTSTGITGLNLDSTIPIIIIGIGIIAIIVVISKSKKVSPKTSGQTAPTAATQPSGAPAYRPISTPNSSTPLYGQSSSTSRPSGGMTMSSRTSGPAYQSPTQPSKSYVANKKLTQYQKDTLENLFTYSNRVFIYDAASRLRLSRDDLMALYRSDPAGFKGYRIEGEYLEAVGDSTPKQGSTSGIRFCEVCGNPLDQIAMDRLNKMGSVFCGYCGKKMQR